MGSSRATTWNGAGGCVIASHGAVQRSRIGDDRYLERGNSAGAHAIRRQKRPPLKALSGSSFPLADAACLLIWARRSHFFPGVPLQEIFVQTAPLLIVSW
jgi:hypothetical protein